MGSLTVLAALPLLSALIAQDSRLFTSPLTMFARARRTGSQHLDFCMGTGALACPGERSSSPLARFFLKIFSTDFQFCVFCDCTASHEKAQGGSHRNWPAPLPAVARSSCPRPPCR